MKNTYILNSFLFNNIADWGLQQKDFAQWIDKSEQAMSKAIANNSFTMQDIRTMAYNGMFTDGSFIRQDHREPKHIARTNKPQNTDYRLHLLVYDCIQIYGNQEALSRATGISKDKLRIMKKVVTNESFLEVTNPKVLDKIMFRDVLTLLSLLDDVNFWRYFVGAKQTFPVTEDMEHQMVPMDTYLLIEADRDAIIRQAAEAKEKMEATHEETCNELKKVKKECKDLKLQLDEVCKENKSKGGAISSFKSERDNIFQDFQTFVSDVEAHIFMIEKNLPELGQSAYIVKIRDMINKANESFEKEKQKK